MPVHTTQTCAQNACLSRTHSLEELSPPELSSMSCSSLLSGAVSETYTLSDGVRTGEVLVYYDSAWSTDEVCFPPVRQRRGPHYQPNVSCRPRAVSIGVGVTAATASPRVRHLGKVMGKAKGLVKIVAKNSIRKVREDIWVGAMRTGMLADVSVTAPQEARRSGGVLVCTVSDEFGHRRTE